MKIQALRVGLVAIAVSLLAGAPTAAQERAPGSTTEGIEVHGHWIIEVYDGNHLVDRREFDNALALGGDIFLADLLSGENSIGSWSIIAGDDICDYRNDGSPRSGCGGVTTVSSPESGDQSGQLILETSFEVHFDGSIASVFTSAGRCSPDTAPSGCTSDQTLGIAVFTEKSLASTIDVVAGQQVNVTVIISFTG